MPTFDTPGPVTAIVELPIGELRVVASERDDTTVDVLSSAADRSMADDVRVELVGTELRVTGPSLGLLQKLTPRTPGRSLEVEIGLPAGSDLRVRSTYGAVTAAGRLGACSVDARYGDVRLDDAASATVTVGYGYLRVNGAVDGDATLTADHGGIVAGRIGGTATLRSKHGAIRVGEIVGEAVLMGAYDAIDVDVLQSGAQVRTAHGSVRLGRVARGEVTMASSHGRLEVGVPATSAVWLDVDTGGRVTNDLTPRDDPDGYADTVSVHARSQQGNIAVRRA